MAATATNYARLASEVFKTGKDAKKAWSEPGFNTGAMKCKLALEGALLYVQLCAEYAKGQDKVWYKSFESIMRWISPAFDLATELSLPDRLQMPELPGLAESATSEFIGAYRAGCERELLQDRVYLSMTPEELSKAKPIYKCEHVWEEPTTQIVYHDLVNPNIVETVTCYENIDLAKCQEQAKQLEKMSNILCVAEILLNTGLVAKAIKKIAGLDAPLVIISVNYKAMATIPAHLHNDPVLRSIAICSLTQQPTRDPVREPRTGRIFEREAITSFINLNHTSPRNPAIPLRVEDLVDCPALKTLIENQLDALSTQANQAADRMRNGQHQE